MSPRKTDRGKGDLTMWRRLEYFQASRLTNAHRMEMLAGWLETGDAAFTPEWRAAGAKFLRRLLGKPALVKAMNAGKVRGGRKGSRKGEDVALYFLACRKLEGDGNYEAALSRTVKAWGLGEGTIKRYDNDYRDLAEARLQEARDSTFAARALIAKSEKEFLNALMSDIDDDHNALAKAKWRVELLEEKLREIEDPDPLFAPKSGQISEMNRRAIAQELKRIR